MREGSEESAGEGRERVWEGAGRAIRPARRARGPRTRGWPRTTGRVPAVGAEQDDGGLAGDLEGAPRLERRVPQHRERLGAALVDELDGLVEGVLGAVSDDLDLVQVISSELLDVGSFPTAGGSMRRPRPQQHRAFGRKDVRDVRFAASTDVVDDEVGERVALELRIRLDRRCQRAAHRGRRLGLGRWWLRCRRLRCRRLGQGRLRRWLGSGRLRRGSLAAGSVSAAGASAGVSVAGAASVAGASGVVVAAESDVPQAASVSPIATAMRGIRRFMATCWHGRCRNGRHSSGVSQSVRDRRHVGTVGTDSDAVATVLFCPGQRGVGVGRGGREVRRRSARNAHRGRHARSVR